MTDQIPERTVEEIIQDLGDEFRLPDSLVDEYPELLRLYAGYIESLRSEAMGLTMHTVQTFLLERIATMYVIMRWHDLTNAWVGRFSHKEFMSTWMDLVKEWNKTLSSGQAELRSTVLRQAEEITFEALSMVEDETTRQNLRRHFKERFAALGY